VNSKLQFRRNFPNPESDVSMTDADSESDLSRFGTTNSIVDMEDLENQKREKFRSEEDRKFQMRSETLKRELPRPFRVNGAFSRTMKEIDVMPRGDDTKLVQIAHELVKHEMVTMMINDAIQYPTKNIRPPAKINPQNWKFDSFSESELKIARKLLDREISTLTKTFGTCNESEYAMTWNQCQEDLVYLPHVKKYTLNSMIKSDHDKIRAKKFLFDLVKLDFKRQYKRAKNLEKPLSIYLGGYFKVAETKEKSIHQFQKKIWDTTLELQCFTMLKSNEDKAILQRTFDLKKRVEEQQKEEAHLQSAFAGLVNKKNDLFTLLQISLNQKSSKNIGNSVDSGSGNTPSKIPAEKGVPIVTEKEIPMETDVVEGVAPAQS